MIFHNPHLLALLLLLPFIPLIWFWRGMRTVPSSLLLRLLSVALVILALANPTLGEEVQTTGPLVILVDQSDSLTPQGQAAARADAGALAQRLAAEASAANEPPRRIAVLWFGGHVVAPGPRAITGQSVAASDPNLQAALNPAGSNLAAALRRARELLAAGGGTNAGTALADGGRVVLLSDGMPTAGDALAEAQLAAAAGLTIDTVPLARAAESELRVVSVRVPDTLHVGEEYTANIVVNRTDPFNSGGPVETTLRLWAGEQLLGEELVTLDPGDNSFSFTGLAISPGTVRLRAEIDGGPDAFAQNNRASATAHVAPAPRVLLVEGRPGGASELSAALWNGGIETETIPASSIPTRLSSLAGFDGMVLIDVSANDLSLGQMSSVQEFVRSEGRGLVVTGGTSSFGLGAYDDTPLEAVLPVDMDAPPRPERADVALLLIIDRSASMDTAIGVSKFDMAKEAAILATESLQTQDTIGVLSFDTGQSWTVPFQQIGQGIGLKQIQDNIATLPTGGGTNIYEALFVGLTGLQGQTASTRHVVLLTDGRSFNSDDRTAYRQLAEAALAQDITISTIAIGFDSDTELLDDIATWGGGRYYFADRPEDIPKLTLQESEIARSDPSVEGGFQADLATPHPLLRDFAPASLPQLGGYVATTPDEQADVVLRSPEDDPVLVAWQYGLGRAVAWTPSVAAPWADNWPGWNDFSRFWAQLVRYTLPEADSGPIQVQTVPQPDGVRLVVDAFESSGAPLDLANTTAQITLPDGAERRITLRQVAPGRYAEDLRLPGAGAYGIGVTVERQGTAYQVDTGYVEPTSREYLPPAAGAPDEALQGRPLLEAIAATTGGRVLDPATVLAPVAPTPPQGNAPHDPLRYAWMWLLGAALALWLLEIAVRRGIFIRQEQ